MAWWYMYIAVLRISDCNTICHQQVYVSSKHIGRHRYEHLFHHPRIYRDQPGSFPGIHRCSSLLQSKRLVEGLGTHHPAHAAGGEPQGTTADHRVWGKDSWFLFYVTLPENTTNFPTLLRYTLLFIGNVIVAIQGNSWCTVFDIPSSQSIAKGRALSEIKFLALARYQFFTSLILVTITFHVVIP